MIKMQDFISNSSLQTNAQYYPHNLIRTTDEPRHEISNNVECATSKASDQPAHMRSLIRAFASRLNSI